MVTLDKIDEVVAKFARATSIFITPSQIVDPLVPPPSLLTDDTFANFFFSLLNQFATSGIQIKLPMGELRNCKTWQDVSILCFHHQV